MLGLAEGSLVLRFPLQQLLDELVDVLWANHLLFLLFVGGSESGLLRLLRLSCCRLLGDMTN